MYVTPIMGGLMIGIAAAFLLWTLGKVAGISGIFWNTFSIELPLLSKERAWRLAFLLGLIAGPVLVHKVSTIPVPAAPESGVMAAVIAGFIVGLGTRLGSGCTSGHGICGIARFSTRSLLATAVFMFTGFLTVYLLRHVFA